MEATIETALNVCKIKNSSFINTPINGTPHIGTYYIDSPMIVPYTYISIHSPMIVPYTYISINSPMIVPHTYISINSPMIVPHTYICSLTHQ